MHRKATFQPRDALHRLGLREYRCYPALEFPFHQACAEVFRPSGGSPPSISFQTDFHMTQVDHTRMANAIRGLAMDAVEKANSGHPGLPMGAADIATVLFTQ